MVERSGWLPRVSRRSEPITRTTIKNIILTYDIRTPFCKTHRECIDIVKSTQVRHMEDRHLPDISHNFIVSGDGKIYEGRGFNVLPVKNPKFPGLYGKSIEIAFIGHDVNKVPRKDLLNVVKSLNHAFYVTHNLEKQLRIYEPEPQFFLNSAYSKSTRRPRLQYN